MTKVLIAFLNAGLIEKVDGDDERLKKMERAATSLAKALQAEPPQLVGTILAALDPEVSANDPAILRADGALAAEWAALRSIHPSPPINLLRAILLDACSQVKADQHAAILWLTGADTLPLVHLGREEPIVRDVLATLAKRTEAHALLSTTSAQRVPPTPQTPHVVPPKSPAATSVRKVNLSALQQSIAAATGPQYRGKKLASLNPNPHWPNDPSNWSWDFADRMASVIAEELDTLANEISKQQSDAGQSQQDVTAGIIKILNDMQASQQRWVQELLVQSEATRQSEELRLKVLWWSEAMYSRSLCCGYRELPAPVASVAMALDLVDEVTRKPAPASVGYLLAEAVHRLQGAEFGREYVLLDLLRALEEARNRLPASWFNRLGGLPDEGRISLRDLTLFALAGQRDSGLDKKLAQAGLGADVKLSLPTLARALFRQEQAVQIAGGHR